MTNQNEEETEKNVKELRKDFEAAVKRTEKEKEEGKELSDIIKKFNRYYELSEDFCKPFMNDENKTDKKEGIKKVTEYFNELKKFYENPEELLDEFSQPLDTQYDLPLGGLYEKDKGGWEARQNASPNFMRKELESHLFDTLKLWMLAEKAQRYNKILQIVCSDSDILEYANSCRSKDVESNKQCVLPLGGDYDYKKDKYLSKVEDVKKLREELVKMLVSLEQKSWGDSILFWFKNPKFSRELLKKIEGSANSVVEIDEDVFLSLSPFIIKTSEKGSNSLRSEKKIIDYLYKDLGEKMRDFSSLSIEYNNDYYTFPSNYNNIVSLPKIAFFCELENLEILAMHKARWRGSVEMTKSKLDDNQKEKCLGTIAYFLAHIHKKIPLNKSEKGIVDISDYIYKRLDNPFLELKESTKLKISENLTPVLECLVNAPYAIYKDAHPDNFLINDDILHVIALDWEDKGFHPIYFDLVNFCEYSKFITCKEKEKWLKDYVQAHNNNDDNKEGPKLEYNSDFYLSYLNAVIYRSICFSSAWSKPHRGEYKKSRTSMLNKAVMAINVIKNNHMSYYCKYKNNYDSLEKALKEAVAQTS